MGVQKEGSKSESGYVGGFFQLFDWTAKSRKKLFATKSDLPESLKQRRKIDGNLNMMHPYLVDEDEIGVGASIRGSNDHSYASSIADDELCGKKGPGVVARLMGLDSLPSSSSPDPYSSPYFDSRSLQDAQYWRTNLNHQVLYSEKLLEKVESSSRNLMEPKPQSILSRPIEKFQKEVMPPKSAKSIPVTHHKLLSPIKSPGFVPTNNAAYIMEAASRILEPGLQASAKAKTKTPLVASSSSTMSLTIRDLKERVEASQKVPLLGSSSKISRIRDKKENREISHRINRISDTSQRSVESNSAKSLRGKSLNKSWNGSLDTPIRSTTEPREDSSGKNIGKSISLAIQAKVNVQRREGLSLSAGKSLVDQKEHPDFKTNQPLKANAQNSSHKKSSSENVSGVLKQNSTKQNHSIEKDKLSSKQVVSNSHSRKVLTGDSGCHRSSSSKSTPKSKAGLKKPPSTQVTDSEKEVLYSSTNNFPRKKRSTDRDWNHRVVDKLFTEKPQRPLQSNPVSNQHNSWTNEVKRKDMDVVSFTFTTPLGRNNSGFETSGQVGLKTDGLYLDHHMKRVLLDTDSTRSPLGYNVIGGDALGILLDQKLRELTNGVESSCGVDSFKGKPSSSNATKSNDLLPATPNSAIPQLQQKQDQDAFCSRSLDSDISFSDLPDLSFNHRLWAGNMEECKSNLIETESFICRSPSPISVLDPSFSTESFESSSFSTDTASAQGSKLCSSSQSLNFSSRKPYLKEADTDLSDSACSTSTKTMAKNHTSSLGLMKVEGSSTWELDYVSDILCNVELMYMDFAIGRARDIVNPHLFNQLESKSRRKGGFESDGGESRRTRRKAIFDCVSECLDLRCRRYVGGGYKMWAKGIAMVRRNDWLAREVYKEISSWNGLEDSMVDELVDKDMSSQYGRWLDFEVDTFELGAEVEDHIFNSLVDDVVADILQS